MTKIDNKMFLYFGLLFTAVHVTKTKYRDIQSLNQTFSIFTHSRYFPSEKEFTRQYLVNTFRAHGLEVQVQTFKSVAGKGVNVIGVLPGKKRVNNEYNKDKIILIGAHYDTVKTTSGVDDNGSGMVALLEVLKLFNDNGIKNGTLEHTVMLVAFDLEEFDLLGSQKFVNDYLIPRELDRTGRTFLGAYIMDVVMYFNDAPNTQMFPSDVMQACAEVVADVRNNQNKGDFMTTATRAGIDDDLVKKLFAAWEVDGNRESGLKENSDLWTTPVGGETIRKNAKTQPSTRLLPSPSEGSHLPRSNAASQFKLRSCRAALNNIPPSFSRSDHWSFWYHSHRNYTLPLKAAFLTDLGPFRGKMKECYHQPCDDTSLVTSVNLSFLKATVDALYRVVTSSQ
jgi:hypothetical protein